MNIDPQGFDYAKSVRSAINDQITALAMTFDTKTLATVMMHRAAGMLRAVHSAGLWTEKDVRDFVEGCLVDIYDKLPDNQTPKVATLGMSDKPS